MTAVSQTTAVDTTDKAHANEPGGHSGAAMWYAYAESSRRDPSAAPPTQSRYANPYLCGIALGLVLVASYLVLGTGLGASAAPARLVAQLELWLAPAHAQANSYLAAWGEQPLRYYLVFMFLGTFLGGLVSAVQQRRVRLAVEKGRAYSTAGRLLLALSGGVLVGFASRLARGCTSGQALSGGALLVSGSLVFVACVFVGGYAAARFVRRQWDD